MNITTYCVVREGAVSAGPGTGASCGAAKSSRSWDSATGISCPEGCSRSETAVGSGSESAAFAGSAAGAVGAPWHSGASATVGSGVSSLEVSRAGMRACSGCGAPSGNRDGGGTSSCCGIGASAGPGITGGEHISSRPDFSCAFQRQNLVSDSQGNL